MITKIEDYFTKGCGRCDRFATPECSALLWNDGIKALREICLGQGLQEVVKWAHPTYMHAGRNIAIIGAFRNDFRLNFMNAALLDDTNAVLEHQGPNSQTKGTIRFTSVNQVAERASILRAYLQQLMGHAEAGTKPPKLERDIEMPEELSDALDSDPALSEAFHALTPGRQRSYMYNLNQAKQPATRIARIEKFRPKIFSGKGATER